MSDAVVVAGDTERMRRCSEMLSRKLSADNCQVVVFQTTNLPSPAMLIQVRKKDGLGGPPRTCSVLKMSVVPRGISVKAFDGTWYDVDDGSLDCWINEWGIKKLTTRLYDEAMMFFSQT